MKRNLFRIVVVVCAIFAVRIIFDRNAAQSRPEAAPQRDMSQIERATAEGRISQFSADANGVSVWSKDFTAIEPALRSVATSDDEEIRLMRGNTQVGTFTRRAGIRMEKTP